MSLKSRYDIGDVVFYPRLEEQQTLRKKCPTCEGTKLIQVITKDHVKDVKCPFCNGRGKTSLYRTVRIIEEVSIKSVNMVSGKIYYTTSLDDYVNEDDLFETKDEANKRLDNLMELS